MKVWLMHENRDVDANAPLPPNANGLVQDLGIGVLLEAMSATDPVLLDVCRRALLTPLKDSAAILYRQQILIDAMKHPEVIRQLYALAVEAIEREKRIWGWMTTKYPSELLHRSVEVLRLFADMLTTLRKIADKQASEFQSKGFRRLFAMLQSELDDSYLVRVRDHLERLEFRDGILMSSQLGAGNKGTHFILRKPPDAHEGWLERLQDWLGSFRHDSSWFTYEVAERDEAGFNALAEIKSQGIASVATALAQSTNHILDFFKLLRLELGFYVGCLGLCDRLAARGEAICIPTVACEHQYALTARGLYDPGLALGLDLPIVPNDIAADGKRLIVITGANRGGKSTLLRAVGLAQTMMQCGMFVAADAYVGSVCDGVLTHFKREEDAAMKSGKLDEELARMSEGVDYLMPHSLVLLNESFASTNEREGSEIGRQIVRALLAAGVRVIYVTHMFDLASAFYAEHLEKALFLRAERLETGERTFRLVEGEPLPTSYGEDLFLAVFGDSSETTDRQRQPQIHRA